MTPTDQDKELREKLAAIEHQRWADWQRWMHKKARMTDQGHLIIDREDVERWERQIATPYSDLSEKEKASDMEQVDRYWQLITADRKRVAMEARENISKLYEKELDMHRKFMDSVIANNQLKTTAMYCIKCGTELFNIKEQPDDKPE